MAENTIKDVKLKIGTENQFQSKLKELPISTLVGTTDPIQEGELDTSIITKLNKAENALPKPTNDTTGSAGQVLKKTANGSEWGDAPSGGGKLYLHYIIGSTLSSYNNFNVCLYTSSSEPIDSNVKASNALNIAEPQNRKIIGYLNGAKKYCCAVIFDKSTGTPAVRVEYLSEAGSNVAEEAEINNDFVTEL